MGSASERCAKCGGAMDEGYVVDHGHANRPRVAEWVEGPPERAFWAGLDTKDRAVLEIVTWRCRSCGRLESYAY